MGPKVALPTCVCGLREGSGLGRSSSKIRVLLQEAQSWPRGGAEAKWLDTCNLASGWLPHQLCVPKTVQRLLMCVGLWNGQPP